MQQILKDTAGLGTLLWLIGYLAGIVLYFTPLSDSLGWVIMVIFTPITLWITLWWFCARDLPLRYYAGVGVAWTALAVVLDYLFIVLLFNSSHYYAMDIFVYYAMMFLIPVGVGMYINRGKSGKQPGLMGTGKEFR
jgi:hypothetical protein